MLVFPDGVDSGEILGMVYDDAKNNGKEDSAGGDHIGSSSHQPPPGTEMDDYYLPQNYSMFSDENPNGCSVM